MKKNFAIYLVMSVSLLLASCVGSDTDDVASPYAMITSFSIGNITSDYPAFTSTGADTLVTKTYDGSSFPFAIDQVACEVYNVDSLPYSTKVDKVVVNIGLNGYATIFVDSTGVYEGFSSTDSLDFTRPRNFRITSLDGQAYRDYTVSVNVHQVNPDLMVWDKYSSIESVAPLRALEYNGMMCLFGESAGQWVVARTPLEGVPVWQQATMIGLPSTAKLATVQAFDGALYLVAEDGVYTSEDAVNWTKSYSANGLLAIVGASESDGKMWVASGNELFFTADGINFENAGALPAGFPLYGVSLSSYTLGHHTGIVRYMLVGYADEAMDGKASVWSRLSTEDKWVKYENANSQYLCPSLKGLSVLRYDNFLYALGGAGTAQGESAEAFSSFYISRDNGITWKAPSDFYQRLPEDLRKKDIPFVTAVDSNNVMWILCVDKDGYGKDLPIAWKGIVNRLGFKKK